MQVQTLIESPKLPSEFKLNVNHGMLQFTLERCIGAPRLAWGQCKAEVFIGWAAIWISINNADVDLSVSASVVFQYPHTDWFPSLNWNKCGKETDVFQHFLSVLVFHFNVLLDYSSVHPEKCAGVDSWMISTVSTQVTNAPMEILTVTNIPVWCQPCRCQDFRKATDTGLS